VLGELWNNLQIFERRHGTDTGLTPILAAELHGKRVWRAECTTRIVAGGAGHSPGGGKRGIGKNDAAEGSKPRRARIGLCTAERGVARLCDSVGGAKHNADYPSAKS